MKRLSVSGPLCESVVMTLFLLWQSPAHHISHVVRRLASFIIFTMNLILFTITTEKRGKSFFWFRFLRATDETVSLLLCEAVHPCLISIVIPLPGFSSSRFQLQHKFGSLPAISSPDGNISQLKIKLKSFCEALTFFRPLLLLSLFSLWNGTCSESQLSLSMRDNTWWRNNFCSLNFLTFN